MEYLIKNIKKNTYYFGCFDISAFGMPRYMAFGNANVAEAYYTLQEAVERLQFIFENDSTLTSEELAIHNTLTGENISTEQALKLIQKTKSKTKKQTKAFYKQLYINNEGKNGI